MAVIIGHVHMPTKGQILVIYAGASAILLLTAIYEAVLQIHSQMLSLDLWFALCLIIILAVDVVSEYYVRDNKLRLLSFLITYSGLVIFVMMATYKFLILMGFSF